MADIDKSLPNTRTELKVPAPEQEVDVTEQQEQKGPVEVTPDEDGGATIDFEPSSINQASSQSHFDNLADILPEDVLDPIGSELKGNYMDYKMSRKDWEQSYMNGLDLLGFKYENRNEPFQGASGATHPVLAEAVTQFQALAYKELMPADGPVRTQIIGISNPAKEAQSQRVKDFMNFQLMDQMKEYESEFDQMLFHLPLAGSTFKKVYYDDLLGRAVSKFIPADDLVVPYTATSLDDAEAVVHVIKISENDLRKQQVNGFYSDIELSKPSSATNADKVEEKERELEGTSKSGRMESMYTLLEFHVNLDIIGFEDLDVQTQEPTGIRLPYIVTIEEQSGEILSIYRNYAENDPQQKKRQYFVHFKFLPGFGFYGFGLLHTIGGLSRAATSILRQLIDAGTLSNLPAGFKARGIRIRDSDEPLSPGEFRDIDVPGGALRESILPLPYKEPSQTLMALLGFIVDAGRRFAAIADLQVGDGNQQAAVGTTVALLERGSKVMSAIHKRLHYAQKQEFRMLARVFAESLPPMYPYDVYGAEATIKQADFDERVDVIPVSDPNIYSMSQRLALAQTQLQLAQTNPQMHNLHEAYRRIYEAIGVHNIEALLPTPEPPQPTDPSIENARAIIQQNLQAFPTQDHDAHMTAHIIFMKTPVPAASPPVFALLQAHLCEHIALKARGVADAERRVMIEQSLQAGQQPPPVDVESRVAELIAQYTEEVMAALMPPPEGEVDPLVQLRSKELDIKAADLQRKASEFDQRLVFDVAKEAAKEEMAAEKIDSQEDIAMLRAEVNRERIRQGTAGRGE